MDEWEVCKAWTKEGLCVVYQSAYSLGCGKCQKEIAPFERFTRNYYTQGVTYICQCCRPLEKDVG